MSTQYSFQKSMFHRLAGEQCRRTNSLWRKLCLIYVLIFFLALNFLYWWKHTQNPAQLRLGFEWWSYLIHSYCICNIYDWYYLNLNQCNIRNCAAKQKVLDSSFISTVNSVGHLSYISLFQFSFHICNRGKYFY